MKIVFFGTPELAAVALKKLIESRHEVVAVVTQPDKASGRGMKTKYLPVKQTALDAGIRILQPESVRNEADLDEIEAIGADLFVVEAYSQLLPKRLLDMAPYGCINIHPSLLPKYRGAAPLRGPIINGDPVTGVTIMEMDVKLDSGDILLQEEFPLDPKETVRTLSPKVAEKGAELLLKVIEGLEAGTLTPVPQDEEGTTYIPQLKKEDGRIDFSDPAVNIERQIRACDPWPSAFTYLSGKVFKIWNADVVSGEEVPESGLAGAPSGSVAYADKKTVIIQCGQDFLKLIEVQMEGKKRMGIDEFLRGKKLEAGFVFGE